MTEFEAILAECIDQIASGESSLEECLAQYPQYEAQLEPLLYTAMLLGEGREIRPSPFLRVRIRSELSRAMKKNPRRWLGLPLAAWRFALNVAVLVLALVMTNTVFAQRALPGEQLYDWKLASENFWRVVTTDPLGTDLKLSERRIDEYVAVSDEQRRKEVLLGYNQLMVRFKAEDDESDRARILNVLKSQRDSLHKVGLSIPELESYFSGGGQ